MNKIKSSYQGDENIQEILSVQQLSNEFPVFSISTIRWFIHCSTPRYSSKGEVPANGFAECMIRVGRRIYIDKRKFLIWLQRQNEKHKSNNP